MQIGENSFGKVEDIEYGDIFLQEKEKEKQYMKGIVIEVE